MNIGTHRNNEADFGRARDYGSQNLTRVLLNSENEETSIKEFPFLDAGIQPAEIFL
jgi:hypothetical protein